MSVSVWFLIGEGLVIVTLLCWEIFWLSRMYYALMNMPSTDQIKEMVTIMKEDGEAIRTAIGSISSLAKSLAGFVGIKLGG